MGPAGCGIIKVGKRLLQRLRRRGLLPHRHHHAGGGVGVRVRRQRELQRQMLLLLLLLAHVRVLRGGQQVLRAAQHALAGGGAAQHDLPPADAHDDDGDIVAGVGVQRGERKPLRHRGGRLVQL